jgi:SRSO17 transposase
LPSSLPAETPLERLVSLANLCWRVEHDYRELEDALGLDQFEGGSAAGISTSPSSRSRTAS